MLPDLSGTMAAVSLIDKVINYHDRALHQAIFKVFNGNNIFAVSWILTWFMHDARDMSEMCRFMDLILVSPSSFPVYLSAAVLLSLKRDIFKLSSEEDAFPLLYQQISRFDVHAKLQDLLPIAEMLMSRYPLQRIKSWNDDWIRFSVLQGHPCDSFKDHKEEMESLHRALKERSSKISLYRQIGQRALYTARKHPILVFTAAVLMVSLIIPYFYKR